MLDLTTLTLTKGAHDDFKSGACMLEAASYLAGEKWTDNPACVSTVLGTFGRSLNDILPDGLRQKLIPLIPQIVGTADDGQDEARSFMALDWLIRTHTPTLLELAKLTDEANSLRALDQIVDIDTAELAGPVVRTAGAAARDAAGYAARDAAGYAAWDAARDAAGYAAWDAAWDAARDAAGYAAWDAARDAAGYAAWDAAWDAARDAAGYAAWDAARDAAGDAAGYAAWDAARAAAGYAAWDAARAATGYAARDAAGYAAWDAAGAYLQPTVDFLQESAIDLFTRMINPGTHNV